MIDWTKPIRRRDGQAVFVSEPNEHSIRTACVDKIGMTSYYVSGNGRFGGNDKDSPQDIVNAPERVYFMWNAGDGAMYAVGEAFESEATHYTDDEIGPDDDVHFKSIKKHGAPE